LVEKYTLHIQKQTTTLLTHLDRYASPGKLNLRQ